MVTSSAVRKAVADRMAIKIRIQVVFYSYRAIWQKPDQSVMEKMALKRHKPVFVEKYAYE
jgi:hypothetical protein